VIRVVDVTSTEPVPKDQIKELIVKLLVEELDIQRDQIVDSATMEELDLDSLDMVEIAQVAQRQYGVRVRPSDAEGIHDLGGMIDLIYRKVNTDSVEAEAPEDEG
jgi:acyl carrier protein